ncbi:PIR protein [Plasmodium ovale]|uniref:PIR protein n=1 Tax=Plasmodium ovale TaxID=36330 RepID=A0A1D3JFT0_PLAOA|nr:PIR protein [Plasmodium ovale]
MADVENENDDRNVPCTYLNMWLYYKEKIHKIPEELIKKIFRIADELIQHLEYHSECKYDESHKNHQEPYKIMLLNIFLDNIDAIEEIMQKDKDSKQVNCLNFVKKCLSIYNNIKTRYCLGEEKDHTFKATCEEIKTFEKTYESTFSNESPLNEKMPSITHSDPILPDRVTSEYQARVSMTDADDNTVIPGSDHASTIGGTVAGMSSFLLLMYKFTPFGRWLRSRINGTGMSNNLDEEEINHMYLNAYENDSMYSDDMGYNMGYNTM